MKTRKNDFRLALAAIGAVCCAMATPTIAADSEEMAKLTKPESSITGGGSYVSGDKRDRARFGQYNGMRDGNTYGNFDFDYTKRDDATGLWTVLQGRNLMLDTREFRFSQQMQGDWKLNAEYNAIVRNYPSTINTRLDGIGTRNLTVTRGTPGTGSDIDLKTKREGLGFGFEKWLSSAYQFETAFKTEHKTGARIFGRGQTCNVNAITVNDGNACTVASGAILLLPEPIDYTMNNFDARLNYHKDKLALSAAYYGSWFTNSNGSMNQTFNGLLFNPNGSALDPRTVGGNNLAGVAALGAPLALQPNNQSHQLSLAGNYAFTPSTRSTFKLSMTRGIQDQSYSSMGLSDGTEPRSSLGAVVDTIVGQAGITSRITDKMSLLANLKFDRKSDKTPTANYYNTTGKLTTNGRSSHDKITGKLEATYQFPMGYRGTIGADVDFRDLGMPFSTQDTSGQAAALRQKTVEWGYRAEVRKSMSETLNGSLGLARSQRNGSTWVNSTTQMTQGDSTFVGAYNLFPLFFVDLTRDKVKGSVDWAAMDNLSVQVFADASREHYLPPSIRGARDGATRNLGLDTSYTINENWKLNGWLSRGDQILDINGASGAYSEGMRTLSHTLGLGLHGKPASQWELGADARMSYETTRYAQGYTTGQPAFIGNVPQPLSLPAVVYSQFSLNLSAKYAIDKKSDIRINYLLQRYQTNEWYWSYQGVPYFFSDGTTVSQQSSQNVNMMTVNYTYNF